MKFSRFLKAIFVSSPLFFGAVTAMPAAAQTQTAEVSAQEIANHFSQIRTMTGEFIQFGPRGEMTEGTFYMERPGKIRFVYKNSPIRVIADGKSVVINNKKLDTWDLYQLKQTPMKMLLDNKIDLSGGKLIGFRQDTGATTIELADKTMGGGKIRMIFDPKTYELRQWTMVDRQNLETTVQVTNIRTGVQFAKGMFDIDYQRIAMKRRP